MENTADKEQNADVDIAPDGDLVLVVGPDETKFRVSSALLMAASKPFSAMLGQNWKEGNSMRSRDGPYHLSLPEDNATALRVICSIIHYQNDKVPWALAANEVLELAITADKYDLVNAMKFATDTWLRAPGQRPESLMLLATAAYLLGNAQAFKDTTRALVLNWSGCYLAFQKDEVQSVLPWKVFFLLEEQRGLARLKLADNLIRAGGTNLCDYGCAWSGSCVFAWMQLLGGQQLWPQMLSRVSISQAINMADVLEDPVPQVPSIECRSSRYHQRPPDGKSRRFTLDTTGEKFGLCLRCVQLDTDECNCSEHIS